MRVVADEACAPELRPWALRKIAGNEAGAIDGWYKQQLIKLSCSFTVQVLRQQRRKPPLQFPLTPSLWRCHGSSH